MPLLAGETLARRIERSGRLEPREAWRILRELAAGLAAVHEVGVVHRDFKSDNVFLVRGDDGDERPVVMDFGLARALEQRDDKHRTTGRVLIGTPAYMAPEQVESKATARRNLTSMPWRRRVRGAYRAPAVPGGVRGSGCAGAASELRCRRRQSSEISTRPDAIVQRCLRRAPEQRYRTLTELAGALDRVRDGERRRSWWPAMAATAAALIVTAVGWMIVQPRPPSSVSPASEPGTEHVARTAAALLPDQPTAPGAAPPVRAEIAESLQGRPVRRARLSVRAPRTSASQEAKSRAAQDAPLSAASTSRSADDAPSDDAPFARPTAERPRQADDLVNPF